MNLFTMLEMAADAMPDRVALRCGDTRMTYAELIAAARGAATLIAADGVQRVGYLGVNGPAAPIALFGAALAGVPYVPINYRLAAAEIAALRARIAPALVIADADDAIAPAAFVAAAIGAAPRAGDPPDADRAIAVELFTSGTTGAPKAAILRHDNLVAYILGSVEFMGADEDDATIVTVPPYHIAGIAAVLSSIYAGRRMIQLPAFDPAQWLQLARAHRVSNAFLVPTMLQRIVEHCAGTQTIPALPALRAIAYGGGKMPLAVIEQAMTLFPAVDFTNAYGLTETSSTICLLDPAGHRAALTATDPLVRRRLGSVGKPLPTVELVVRDDAGGAVPAGTVGLVHVRGDQIAGEYHGAGSLLDDDGWFLTRDRGYLDADGYLFLDGRADDVIVRGGENISPGEIEDVLLAHDAVADVAVVGVPDAQWGEAIGAVVVLSPDCEATATALCDHVRDRLRSSRVPQHVRFVTELPFNETGKLLRRVVREQFAAD